MQSDRTLIHECPRVGFTRWYKYRISDLRVVDHLTQMMSITPMDSDATTICAPDIITYRLKGKMVYVSPALNYEVRQLEHKHQKVFWYSS